jgi:hypothetical protein
MVEGLLTLLCPNIEVSADMEVLCIFVHWGFCCRTSCMGLPGDVPFTHL